MARFAWVSSVCAVACAVDASVFAATASEIAV